jgi:hypothetical protein
MQVTLLLLQGNRSLREVIGVSSDTLGLPSWIKQNSNSEQHGAAQSNRVYYSNLFRAAGSTSAKIEQNSDTLVVDAFAQVNTVATVRPVMFKESNNLQLIVNAINA